MSKKGKNWLEKFRDFWWDELTQSQRKCLWDTLAAIRGPDKHPLRNEDIKWCTTARIRYLLLGEQARRVGGYGSIFSRQQSPPTREIIDSLAGFHFLNHIVSAIKALKGVVKKNEMKDLLELLGTPPEKK